MPRPGNDGARGSPRSCAITHLFRIPHFRTEEKRTQRRLGPLVLLQHEARRPSLRLSGSRIRPRREAMQATIGVSGRLLSAGRQWRRERKGQGHELRRISTTRENHRTLRYESALRRGQEHHVHPHRTRTTRTRQRPRRHPLRTRTGHETRPRAHTKRSNASANARQTFNHSFRQRQEHAYP
jgi:hypothetical protein